MALISRVTLSGDRVAVVDATDAFDPTSAVAAGADLSRLLWVKCGGRVEAAWRAADLLVRCPGFGLVAVDLGDRHDQSRGASSFCRRLQRAVEQSDATLVLRASRPLAGTAAALVVSMRRLAVRWIGAPRPTRFVGLVSEAQILRARTRSRSAPREGQCVEIPWGL